MKASLSYCSLNLFLNLKKNLLLLFLLVLFAGSLPISLFAQSSYSITCPADIVQNNDPGTCTARVNYPVDTYNGNPMYSFYYSRPSGAPYPVGTTKVLKQLLDQNGAPLATCSFNITVVDKEAPVLTNCPGDLSANNTAGVCGAVVTFTRPTVFEKCTHQQKAFYYTGAPAFFTVPAGVTSIDVSVYGAQGGHTYYNNTAYGNPGWGGETDATIAVTPGQVLSINVGGVGHDANINAPATGGYNGGGNGTGITFDNSQLYQFAGGGGGGASDIRTAGGTLADRIVVAGGGGGAATVTAGGNGGDLVGGNGKGEATYPFAMGGTQTAGGTGGAFDQYLGGDGTLGIGGNGADSTPAGGGGGGLYGGGGGSLGSGAGGSSYTVAGSTNIYHTAGAQEGDGFVNFSYEQPALLVQTAGLASGSTFPVGETINTFTATDPAGNTAACSFKVTVTDNQQPVITAPANISVSSDNNSCAATNVGLGTPVTSDNCGVASVTSNAPASFPTGTTTVTWTVTDTHGNSSVASQTVTVADNQRPVLTVPAAQTFGTAATSYNIPTLIATDNCGIASVTFAITGATTRTASGTDASGSFNTGTSLINYTVTDVNGNVQTGSTSVSVTAAPAIAVAIADVWAVSPGGSPNTIYIGYGPSYITLKADVTSGKSPYTYEWVLAGYKNVISRSQSLPVFIAGDYTVTVTDSKGVTGTFKKHVYVVDVRCGINNEKVIVCKEKKDLSRVTACVLESNVQHLLANGGYLGDCTTSFTTPAVASAARATVIATPEVVIDNAKKFSVYPNPTSGIFNVQLNNFKAGKAEILILSQNGIVVQRRSVTLTAAFQNIAFNIANLAPGIYLVKAVSDEGIQTAKVVLQH